MKLSHRRSIQAALVVAAGAIAVFFLWRGRPHAAAPAAATPAAAALAHSSELQRAAALQPAAPGAPRGAAASAAPSLAALTDSSRANDYEESPLGEVLQRVLSNDQQLATFKYYHNRPLLDEASKARYHGFLSDPAVFAAVRHDLLYPEEIKVDQAGNIKRLMKIDYLREALEWQENPMRRTLIALVSELILTDNFPASLGMDMRRSLSGNKMELYELLYQFAPDQANATLQASKGTRLEKLIDYIDNSLQVRRRLEASLDNEVTP
jgi:hypothetical protein